MKCPSGHTKQNWQKYQEVAFMLLGRVLNPQLLQQEKKIFSQSLRKPNSKMACLVIEMQVAFTELLLWLFIHCGSCIYLVNLFSKEHKWQSSEMQSVVIKIHLSMSCKVLFCCRLTQNACTDKQIHTDGS